MPPPRLGGGGGVLAQLQRLSLKPAKQYASPTAPPPPPPRRHLLTPPASRRSFCSGAQRHNWLLPQSGVPAAGKQQKGRPPVHTGGSTKGTTVVWGDYGLRMKDFQRRISARQLQIAEEKIKRRLRGMTFKLYKRVVCNVAVYKKGNESRMGGGKGRFDHWAARAHVYKVIFEISGNLHEQVVRDALRLAGNALPGSYEFIKKGDPAVMGITKLTGSNTPEYLKRPRLSVPLSLDETARRLPSSTPS